MMWRANIDWQPDLSKRVVINYITKYVAKPKKGSEAFHDMLMCVSSIQNPNEPTTCTYKSVLCESIVDEETCHFLLELPLSEYSH